MLFPRTPTRRSNVWRVAVVLLVALSFVARATLAVSAPDRSKTNGSPALSAGRNDPAAPAGPQGPIKLTCLTGHPVVIGSDGPAGPQGPVGSSCSPEPKRG